MDTSRQAPYIFRGKQINTDKPIFIGMASDNDTNLLTFEFAKKLNGIDFSSYEIQLLLNGDFIQSGEDIVTETTGLTVNRDLASLKIQWLVGNESTYQSGEGQAQFRFVGANSEVWHSNVFSVKVESSINADEAEAAQLNVIVDHTARILSLEIKYADILEKAETGAQKFDSKLDKISTVTIEEQAYIKLPNGQQAMQDVSVEPLEDSIVKRTETGEIKASDAVEENEVVTKRQLDGFRNRVQTAADNVDYAITVAIQSAGVADTALNNSADAQAQSGRAIDTADAADENAKLSIKRTKSINDKMNNATENSDFSVSMVMTLLAELEDIKQRLTALENNS